MKPYKRKLKISREFYVHPRWKPNLPLDEARKIFTKRTLACRAVFGGKKWMRVMDSYGLDNPYMQEDIWMMMMSMAWNQSAK